MDDYPTGVHWIKTGLIGLKQKKMKNIKKQRPMQRRMTLNFVLYFSWPNQPSSGVKGVYIGRGVLYIVIASILGNTRNT